MCNGVVSDHKNKYEFSLRSSLQWPGERCVGLQQSYEYIRATDNGNQCRQTLSLLSSLHSAVVFLTVGGVTVVGTPLIAYSSDKNLT